MTDKDPKDPAEDARENPAYGGYSHVVYSATRGKRPGDRPPEERLRKESKDDASRKPGLPKDLVAEMKSYDQSLAARRGGSPTTDAHAAAPAASTKASSKTR